MQFFDYKISLKAYTDDYYFNPFKKLKIIPQNTTLNKMSGCHEHTLLNTLWRIEPNFGATLAAIIRW